MARRKKIQEPKKVECPDCDGRGECTFCEACEPEVYACRECKGRGNCPRCGGHGEVPEDEEIA